MGKADSGNEPLSKNLLVCSSCNRVKRGDGSWSSTGSKRVLSRTKVSYGLCLDCCENRSMSLPEMKSLLLDKSR